MPIPTSVAVLAQLTAVAVAIGVGVMTARRRHKPGARTLTLLMVAIAAWNGARAASLAIDDPSLAIAAINVEYLGGAVTTILLLVFVLEFTGREHRLTPTVVGALAVEPLALAVVLWTNDRHHLFYASVSAAEDPATAQPVIQHGPLWTLHMAVLSVILLVVVGLLLRKLARTSSLHRSQSAALIVAVVVPTLGTFLAVLADFGVAMPLGFAVMGLALFVSLFGFKLIDLTPVARATVMEQLDAGIVVVDGDDQVTDVNPRGRELLDIGPDDRVVGEHAGSVVPDAQLWERYEDRLEDEDELTVETREGRKTYRVRITPVTGRRGAAVGRVFMIQDVTDRRRREHELELTSDQLSGVASVISHDLRNPLQVAAGHAELIDDERADAVVDSLERIEEIVEDVFSLAREDGRLDDLRSTTLDEVAREAWSHVDTPNATLSVTTDWRIAADPPRLQRLFENLFRNALEHGRTDGEEPISITVGTIDAPAGPGTDRVGFYVADDGAGIPPEVREDAFEAGFTTGDDGTGLGLSIVERIATAHDWRVSIAESEDGGARFEFRGVVDGAATTATGRPAGIDTSS